MSVWHAHSGRRGELWQVFAGDSHAPRTSERATRGKAPEAMGVEMCSSLLTAGLYQVFPL